MKIGVKCPRCGFEQSPTEDCRNCRVNIPKYIELQKRRRAVPSGGVQRPQRSSPPERTQGPTADKSQPSKEEAYNSDIRQARQWPVEKGDEVYTIKITKLHIK